MTKIRLLIALGLIGLSNAQAATCTRADLTGYWKIYTVFNAVSRCTLIMPASGTAPAAGSNCLVPTAQPVALTGNINITADCRLYGSITLGGTTRAIDAYISKGKDSLSGIGWQPGNTGSGDQFSGVKQ
ncbi:hypothetical protein [Methylovulum psychrotolerans]|uniref:Uncharacterized protein n=1 Tax=Methylovulum psychrotolerans TaxID=1704499 RepID=A0A2S5CFQ6_9GAMM|nr:hypothetical protein [Methylovulum psychrotolerans]POZ49643.1 hypothetical protein AADEFJLK_04590 [Methylovulum psychrotolerans]